jgi:hypothetical protein
VRGAGRLWNYRSRRASGLSGSDLRNQRATVGSVALADRMIKAGLSCDLSDSFSLLVAANVRVCRVPVPAGIKCASWYPVRGARRATGCSLGVGASLFDVAVGEVLAQVPAHRDHDHLAVVTAVVTLEIHRRRTKWHRGERRDID